ncbi:TolC family protein [Paenibacillus elgii]|uniref:TolC family protein n=1 Tax=Paenibacillus elgii TaxID=189691 RepID=UPI00203DB75F|nr:TolC family protein [Paenibacillus elgii]MCM3272292.1 TolC family protein [Paenibacillus elgii]
MRKLQKGAVAFVAAAVIVQALMPSGALAEERRITLEEALKLAAAESGELAQSRLQVQAKTIELTQAQGAVANQSEKDSSLLAKAHSLSQDLGIGLKAPEARKVLGEAKRELSSKELQLRSEVEKLFFTMLQAADNAALLEQKWTQAQKRLTTLETKQKFGAAGQEEADKQKEALDRAQSELKVARLALKSAKLQLEEKLGIDPESAFTAESKPDYVVLTQEQLWKFVAHAEKHDFELYKDTEARKMAEEKVHLTRKLYSAKFGEKDMRLIEAMYSTPAMDYELFMANYDSLLGEIKRKWEGIFLIPVPIVPIILPIPKVVLQGEYDGLRYFDDEPYSLPVSMLEADKARLKEQDTRKKLINKVKKSYLDAKTAEEAYAQALKLVDTRKAELEAASKKRAVGWIKDDEFEKASQASEETQKAAIAGYYAYKSALSALNVVSAGALDSAWKPGTLPYLAIDDGLEPIKEQPSEPGGGRTFSGKWTVKDAVEGVTGELTIQVPKELGATAFALLTKDGRPIGGKVPLDGKLVHLNVVFADMSGLKVQFYKDAEVIAEAVPDGYGSSGALPVTLKGKGE